MVNVAARSIFLILTCFASILIGFFLPLIPGVGAGIGSAFWAGLLASGGALAGMAIADAILARIEPHKTGASASLPPVEAGEKTRPRA